jgi:hypothetical protein
VYLFGNLNKKKILGVSLVHLCVSISPSVSAFGPGGRQRPSTRHKPTPSHGPRAGNLQTVSGIACGDLEVVSARARGGGGVGAGLLHSTDLPVVVSGGEACGRVQTRAFAVRQRLMRRPLPSNPVLLCGAGRVHGG